MKNAPPRSITAIIVLGTAAWPSVAYARGYHCWPVRARVAMADTIVIGRTISVDKEEVRPQQVAVVYEFKVEDVLKGNLYRVGDSIVKRYEPRERGIGYSPLPSDNQGRHLVFVSRNENGEDWFACAEAVDRVNLKRVKRQIEVLEDPPAFMDSSDEEAVLTVLDWIRATYLSLNGKREPHADWSRRREPRRDTIVAYVIKHAGNENIDISIAALEVLRYLAPSDAFDVFVQALDSTDDAKISLGALGLKRLADRRAIPLLIGRLKRFRDDEAERQRRIERGETAVPRVRRKRVRGGGPPRYWKPEYVLEAAISSYDDPRVKEFQLAEMKRGDPYGLFAMADSTDPRAVEPLLRQAWGGSSAARRALEKYDDARITEEARERMYDHPFAPSLLAAQGDPEAEEFMLRLIRQGHRAGARWAAETQDTSAKAELVSSMAYYTELDYELSVNAYALGRLRAFELIPRLLDGLSGDLTGLIKATEFATGLTDRPRGKQDDCAGEDAWGCLRELTHEVATRERWSRPNRRLANELFDALEDAIARRPSRSSPNLYRDWSPPDALGDMPDPVDTDATSDYLIHNRERCREVLWTGDWQDQLKVLYAAAYCRTNILDGALAIRLLTGPNMMVRGRAGFVFRDEDFLLTDSEVWRWAFSGDFQSTRMALRYIHRHPKPEFRRIVARILREERHLFDENLFKAIIATEARDCVDLLRAYLENEHFALRFNAAVALVHLDEDAGLATLEELAPNMRWCTDCISREYRQAALERLEQAAP